jgi:hypothetical protein
MVDARQTRAHPSSIEGSCVVYTDRRATGATPPAAAPQSGPLAFPSVSSPARWAVVGGTESAEVRTAPAKVAPVLERLAPGQRVLALPRNPGWSFVRLADGRGGYIADALIVNVP